MVSQKAQKDLRQNTKAASTTLLNERLADAIDLALSVKQAHWNLKGPQFIALHVMLDQLRGEVDGHVDMIAERVAQLGGTALGTTQSVAKATTLRGYPTDIYKSKGPSCRIDRALWRNGQCGPQGDRRGRRSRRCRHHGHFHGLLPRSGQIALVPRGACPAIGLTGSGSV